MTMIFPSIEQKKLLLNMLKVLGGHKARVGFCGAGDSGSIEDAVLYDQHGKEIDCKGITIDWTTQFSEYNPLEKGSDKWVEREETEKTPVLEVLKNITEQMLEREGLDWYNNDGGQGSLEIDLTVSPPTIVLNVGINYTQTDDHEFDYTEFDDESEEEK